MDGTEDSEIYWDDETSEDTGTQKLKKMILLILTVTKSSWPSMMYKYRKFVTGT